MNPFQLYAAPPTPFDAEGGVNLAAIEPLVEHLLQNGVRGAFVCGTTGECANLSVAERQAVAERWVRVAQGRLPLIIHIGAAAQVDSIALAKHAAQIGAEAIAATPPYYYKPQDTEDLIRWLQPVAAAADLPFYYYHIPSMTGVKLPVRDLLRRAQEAIPQLAGAKFTYEDLQDYLACLKAGTKGGIYFGRDEMLLGALALGSRAAVGATYNVHAPLFTRLIAAFDAGDLEAARTLQAKANQYIEVLSRFGNISSLKALLTRQGIPMGLPRLPIRALDPHQRDALFEVWDGLEQL